MGEYSGCEPKKTTKSKVLSLRLEPKIYEELKMSIQKSGLSASAYFERGLFDSEANAKAQRLAGVIKMLYEVNRILKTIERISESTKTIEEQYLEILIGLETVIAMLTQITKDGHTG
jgi:hypothetical protein